MILAEDGDQYRGAEQGDAGGQDDGRTCLLSDRVDGEVASGGMCGLLSSAEGAMAHSVGQTLIGH